MQVKILMADHHPSQIEGYKAILEYNKSGYEIEATTASTIEAAYKSITSGKQFDVVFLDHSLPPFAEKAINSGSDLAILVQNYMPKAKIVMITSYAEAFLLYHIVKKIHPSGLLVKSEFTRNDLLNAFDLIMKGKLYYSEIVKHRVKNLLSTENYLDSYNRHIITLLAQGVRTKNIPEILKLSQSAVEKRKAYIKEYFLIEKGNDEDVVREARRKGSFDGQGFQAA